MECTGTSTSSDAITGSAGTGGCNASTDPPASAVTETCTGSWATRARRDLAGFGIQYWGEDYTAEALAAAPHRALIIEASVHGADVEVDFREQLFSAEEVSAIRHGGKRPVFAYLNVGELVPYRNYWINAFGPPRSFAEDPIHAGREVPAWYGGVNEEGEYLAAFWTPEWLEVLRNQMDNFLDRGYDGVFLDDALHYYTWTNHVKLWSPLSDGRTTIPGSLPEFAEDMMALILHLGTYARHDAPSARPDFAVIVNGAPYIGWDAASEAADSHAPHPLFNDYVQSLDAIAMESALGTPMDWATLDALQQNYAARGVPVLSIDYHSRHPLVPIDEFRAGIAQLAHTLGFIPYVAADEVFSRLDPPVLPATGSVVTAQGGCD